MKVRDFEANERYRLFNRNKSTLTVHFYLSTPPSEKIGICPERDSNPRLPDY